MLITAETLISVCIPVGPGREPSVAYDSLIKQNGRHALEFCFGFDDQGKGANWARNQAWLQAEGQLLLWSDDDINWEPNALNDLKAALNRSPEASYSYGAWKIIGGPRDGLVQCDQPWDAKTLIKRSCVSTMSLMKAAHFPMFDEQLGRLQDWDLYLTMWLNRKMFGVNCGTLTFTTGDQGGITAQGQESWMRAKQYIMEKHGV
jgi:hypothetical protein